MKRVVRNAKAAKRAKSEELSGAWATLRDRLAEALGVLEEGQYLVLQGARSPYYVQFAMEADSLLWAEAVSDAFLPKGQKLGKAKKSALGAEGGSHRGKGKEGAASAVAGGPDGEDLLKRAAREGRNAFESVLARVPAAGRPNAGRGRNRFVLKRAPRHEHRPPTRRGAGSGAHAHGVREILTLSLDDFRGLPDLSPLHPAQVG